MSMDQPTLTGFSTDPDATTHLPFIPHAVSPAALTNPKADIAALDELERHLFAHRYASIGITSYGETIDPRGAGHT